MTLLPCTSTVIFLASVSALRMSARSICCFRWVGDTGGLIVMRLVTPLTPERRWTTRSASLFWKAYSTSPFSVTQPWLTVTSTLPAGIAASHLRALSTALARSASVRSAEPGRRTSMSLATALTPRTRWAASSAAIFFRYESTQPVSVTIPSLTATPISLGRTRVSHFNSSRTSAWISSSVRMLMAMLHISFPCVAHLMSGGSHHDKVYIVSAALSSIYIISSTIVRSEDIFFIENHAFSSLTPCARFIVPGSRVGGNTLRHAESRRTQVCQRALGTERLVSCANRASVTDQPGWEIKPVLARDDVHQNLVDLDRNLLARSDPA